MHHADHQILIEVAKPDDAAAVGRVVYETWLATYPNDDAGITKEDIEPAIAKQLDPIYLAEKSRKLAQGLPPERIELVARLNGRVTGIAAASNNPDGIQKIGSLYVLPEFQGLGAGTLLMQRILEWSGADKPLVLTVASYNKKAIDFYRSFGFEITDEALRSTAAQLPGGKTIPEVAMRRPAQNH